VAVIPLFFALGVARLLMVAIPPSIVGSPLVAVHSFFQFLAGFAAIAASAIVVRHQDDRERTGVSFRVLLGSVAAIGVAAVLGGGWDVFVSSSVRLFQGVAPHVLGDGGRAADVQGALGLLPRYQLGLLVGIWLATGTRVNGLGPLRALLWLWGSQLLLLVGVGELTAHLGVSAHAIFIRGWAVAVPIGVYLLLNVRRVDARDREYRDWWTRVGREFPVLTGAPSTDLYFANEVRLLSEQIPDFQHCRFLKSDLWDEAKNTRILQWVAARGARAYGIDISAPIVNSARDAFEGTALAAAIADVRGIPFADNAFDIVYSMGTVEHFAESEAAVREMARVLKPDGRLILGVPNRHDFFLRPALVAVLNRLGCYAYGFEKSYSRRELRGMLERAGLDVVAESGILFIPGWLRMLDLACYTTWRPLARVTAPAVAVFAWIDRRFPRVRRHGYLLASTGVKREGRDQP
jgi:SAM-dependent methyltransferase